MSLQSGLDAFQQGRYQEAVQLAGDNSAGIVLIAIPPDYLTAQMWLMKAYQGTGRN